MKIQLSIARDYAPNWGVWEGVRELVQNWMDAYREGDTIEHDGSRLLITNRQGSLDPKHVAVLGSTDKAGDSTKRGQFGDGLKVGCLALIRAGLDVRFKSGGRWYSAKIADSKSHGAEVLTFFSRRDRADPAEDGVRFVVYGLTRAEWQEFKKRFLFRGEGPILKDRPGEIFVKDIWVCSRGEFAFGYNLSKAAVGRDRDLVSDFDVRYAAGQYLAKAVDTREVSAQRVMGLLAEGTAEVEYVRNFLSQEARRSIEVAFDETYGDQSVPVHTEEQRSRAAHLGLKPVIVSRALVDAAPELVAKKTRGDQVLFRHDLGDLEQKELENLLWACELVGHEGARVVKFLDDNQLGSRDGGEVNVARRVLRDRWRTLQTVVEEVAHEAGPDGSFQHKWRLHEIYVAIIKRREP